MSDEPLTQVWTRIPPEVKAALENIKTRDGIALEYQIRQGVLMWLDSKDANPLAKPRQKRA